MHPLINSFIHYGDLYSASSRLLLRSAMPDMNTCLMRTRTDCQMQIKATYLFTYLYIYTLMLVLWYFVTYMQTYLCSYFHAYLLPSIHAVYALVFNRYLCKRTYGHTQSVISLICPKKGGGSSM